MRLEVRDPRALEALAEALGEIAADMWLAGEIEIPLTSGNEREIVGA